MSQTRAMSFVEAVTNILAGFGIALTSQLMVFPVFGLVATLNDNLLIGAIFTSVSPARSYILRRLFNAVSINRNTRS